MGSDDYKGQLIPYYQEILNFLRTCSIKFSPFSYTYGASLIDANGYTDIEADWNPYYRNLCGEYQSYDTKMYVYSKEDDKEILFSKDLKTTRPRLFNFYKIPSNEHTLLCKKYPTQIDLIKSILYPVDSVQTCIDAEEFDLLAYDDSLLDENERTNLVETLKKFLSYIRVRWWTKEFVYEDLYPIAFYYMVWQSLPNVLLTQRLYNIGTAYVHPFHIWEYLISKGMQDFRNVLTNKQSLWLYRNLRWVYQNKGKNVALNELTKNILNTTNAVLYGKEVLQQTKTLTSTCATIPEILSYDLDNNETLTDTTSIEQLNLRLYEAGLDHDTTATYLDQQIENYSLVKVNTVPSKFLEIKKGAIFTKWEDLLYTFLIETTLYRCSLNQLNYNVLINDPATALYIQTPIKNAIILLYYVAQKRVLESTIDTIPTTFATHTVYNKDYPQNIPTEFSFLNHTYLLKYYFDTTEVLSKIEYTSELFSLQATFSDFVTSQFSALLTDIKDIRASGDNLYIRAMSKLYPSLLLEKTHTIQLTNYTTYTEWLADASNEELVELINTYTTSGDWDNLYDILIQAVFPITKEMATLINLSEYIEKLYDALKKLFTQLSSYNVTFLDTERDNSKYIDLTNLNSHMLPLENNTGTQKYDLGYVSYAPLKHSRSNTINFDVETTLNKDMTTSAKVVSGSTVKNILTIHDNKKISPYVGIVTTLSFLTSQ